MQILVTKGQFLLVGNMYQITTRIFHFTSANLNPCQTPILITVHKLTPHISFNNPESCSQLNSVQHHLLMNSFTEGGVVFQLYCFSTIRFWSSIWYNSIMQICVFPQSLHFKICCFIYAFWHKSAWGGVLVWE